MYSIFLAFLSHNFIAKMLFFSFLALIKSHAINITSEIFIQSVFVARLFVYLICFQFLFSNLIENIIDEESNILRRKQ